jgi:hypothetical protein
MVILAGDCEQYGQRGDSTWEEIQSFGGSEFFSSSSFRHPPLNPRAAAAAGPASENAAAANAVAASAAVPATRSATHAGSSVRATRDPATARSRPRAAKRCRARAGRQHCHREEEEEVVVGLTMFFVSLRYISKGSKGGQSIMWTESIPKTKKKKRQWEWPRLNAKKKPSLHTTSVYIYVCVGVIITDLVCAPLASEDPAVAIGASDGRPRRVPVPPPAAAGAPGSPGRSGPVEFIRPFFFFFFFSSPTVF